MEVPDQPLLAEILGLLKSANMNVILQLSISTNLLRSSLMVASHVRILVSYTATPMFFAESGEASFP
jgi:hypothetical protein